MLDAKNLFETGQVFGFPVNVKQVLQHVQQDMADDWYSDALKYTDIFNDEDYVIDVILKCLSDAGGIYPGDTRTLRSIPKKGYSERYSLETDIFDRFVYQAICSFLMPILDGELSHRVLSYRYNRGENDDKYLFRNKIRKWLDYEGLTSRFIQNKGFLVVTDVSNFFENISSKQLIEQLTNIAQRAKCEGHRKGQVKAAIRALDDLLKVWSFSGTFGLPQNRDCSSFLSNVLLSSIDFEMRSSGYDYYRYVDDIRIVCGTEVEARKSLQKLIDLLRNVGMSINSSKTDILCHSSDIKKIEDAFPSQNPLVLAVENMWRSKSRRVFIRSIEYVMSIIQDALSQGDTQSRSFRFAVNRLNQLIEADLLDAGSAESKELLDHAINSLSSDAVSTDQLCRLIISLKPDTTALNMLGSYLTNRDVCVHDWQNHKLWVLLSSFKHSTDDLKITAESVLSTDPKTGEAAGIMIWLQATGHLAPIDTLIEAYSHDWPFQNQRYFLIAASGLPADRQNLLRGKIPQKLLGTMQRAKKSFRHDGVALAEKQRPSFAELYEDIKDYA